MDPFVKNLSQEKALKLQKIDIAKNQVIADYFETSETPTFVLFRRGRQVWKSKGELSESEMRLALQRSGM